MTITYRTAGDWGPGKGSNLTPAEVDGNFWDLVQQIAAILADMPTPAEISNITVSGTQMTFFLENGTEFGPFTLPQANFRPSVTAAVTTSTYEPVLTDANCYKRCSNAAGCLVTIPSNAEVAFPVDTELSFRQGAAGAVVFDAATDVTLNGVDGFLNETARRGAAVTAKKVGTNEWDLIGQLAEDVTA